MSEKRPLSHTPYPVKESVLPRTNRDYRWR